METDLIFDVGMHTCQDTRFYLRKGFRVVAIEANPDLCERGSEEFRSEIASGQLTIVNRAIAKTPGRISFYLNERDSVWGTANLDWVRRNEMRGAPSTEIQVDAVTFRDVLAEHGIPYYLKIDIEGSDALCLEGLRGAEDKPKFVSVEASATSFRETVEQLTLMEELGYTRFKIVSQHDIAEQRCPNPPLEGRFVDHHFEPGASGLFGQETPGPWRSLASVRREYRSIHLQHRLVGPNHGIFRSFPSWKVRQLLDKVFPKGGGWYDTHAAR